MASLKWVDTPVLQDPVALVAFEGWGDAGESSSLAAVAFLDDTEPELLAMIDPDDHFDFQMRRPVAELGAGNLRGIAWPRNDLFAVRSLERDLVVVLGEEPHYGWRSFTNELVEALQKLGVRRAVTMGAFIGQVAHTLPVPLVGSATQPETLTLHGLSPSGYEGPTGIVGVLNHSLGKAGIDVISVWAAVPHYLGNQEYPPATEALVVKAAELVGATPEIGDLAGATRDFLSTVDEVLEGNEDLLAYVERLKEKTDDDSPTSDRLVEEIEDFLRHHPR